RPENRQAGRPAARPFARRARHRCAVPPALCDARPAGAAAKPRPPTPGALELVFFLANHEWVRKQLPLGATRWVSGKLEMWDGHLQMVHPDRVMDAEALAKMPAGGDG